MHPSDADDLDFDDVNEGHLAGHGIRPVDALQVFGNDPTYRPNKKGRTAAWLMVGETDGGRALTIAVVSLEVQLRLRPDHGMGKYGRGVDTQTAEGTMSDMDERALAEQIEAMRGDPDAWGDDDAPSIERAPKRRSEQRQRSAVVSVRLTPEELATAQTYAEDRGLSLSGALRAALLEAASVPAVRSVATGWPGGVSSLNVSVKSPSVQDGGLSYVPVLMIA